MKKVLSLLTAVALMFGTFAATTPASVAPKKLNANEVMLPVGSTGKSISLKQLSTISMDDMESLSGRKMNWAEKFAFKKGQRKLARNIEADGTINSKKLNKVAAPMASGGFHIGGFALGFLLGLIGVLIAYLINDDKKRTRVKWSWLGLLAAFILILIFVLI